MALSLVRNFFVTTKANGSNIHFHHHHTCMIDLCLSCIIMCQDPPDPPCTFSQIEKFMQLVYYLMLILVFGSDMLCTYNDHYQ